MDDKPKSSPDVAKHRPNKSFNSDVGDDRAEPEVEFPFRAKRSASFRKAAFNSLKHNFIAKNKTPVKSSNSLQEPFVIVNEHADDLVDEDINERVRTKSLSSIQHTRQSTVDHSNTQHFLVSSKKKMCSNPK